MRRLSALAVAIAAPAVACASLLSIDDRVLDEPDAALAPRDVDTVDASSPDDAADAPFGACDPLCIDAGGRCDASTCIIDCTEGCTKPVVCPPSGACHVSCGLGSCATDVVCKNDGGCIIDCFGEESCHRTVTCESTTCAIHCSGAQACRSPAANPVITCDASVCAITCEGDGSCTPGISASASDHCDIECTGTPSCANGRIQCDSPEAGITCEGVRACANGKPVCSSGSDASTCMIACGPDTTSCGNDYCCEAGTCLVDAGTKQNICP